uniref:Ig-like domain-containing protein n=1 Tax=Oryzias latipes TaxID=8090 RepID=A0A3P9HY76_ORYLA
LMICPTRLCFPLLHPVRISGQRWPDLLKPLKDELMALEGDTVTLSCKYSGSVWYLFLYQQKSNLSPQFIIADLSKETEKFSVKHDKQKQEFHVNISSAAVTDSAVYYCALQPTVTGNNKTLYKNLQKENTPQPPLERVTQLILTMEEHMPSSFCSLHNEAIGCPHIP